MPLKNKKYYTSLKC